MGNTNDMGNRLHYLLMKTNAIFARRIMCRVGSLGITPGQPKILEFLREAGEADQKTIAKYCEIEQATVGSILSRMETEGLISRRQHEGNRRSLFVTLTEKGYDAAEAVCAMFEEADEKAASELTEAELNDLKIMLKKVSQALIADAGEGGKIVE